MATDYGTDLACLDDLADDLRLVSGPDLLKQDAYHRITQADLIDEANWGIDIVDRVGDAGDESDLQAIALAISAAIQKDERFASVTTTASGRIGETPEETFATFDVDCVASGGESFSFVVAVENLTASLLAGEP